MAVSVSGSKGAAALPVAIFSTLILVLVLQPSPVEGVSFLVYYSGGCTGSGTEGGGCYRLTNDVCCSISRGASAIQIYNLLSGEVARVYTGGGCSTNYADVYGPKDGFCVYGSAFSGAGWVYNPNAALANTMVMANSTGSYNMTEFHLNGISQEALPRGN